MRHFWTATGTGFKLRQVIDDAVFTSALSGHTQDFIRGQLAMRQYILGLQSPAPDESAADAEHSTIQEDLHP